MTKINFHFTLLEARFPELHAEAQSKIDGGVDRKDVLADWLNELACYRRGMSMPNKPEPAASQPIEDDIDFAASVMDGLTD